MPTGFHFGIVILHTEKGTSQIQLIIFFFLTWTSSLLGQDWALWYVNPWLLETLEDSVYFLLAEKLSPKSVISLALELQHEVTTPLLIS